MTEHSIETAKFAELPNKTGIMRNIIWSFIIVALSFAFIAMRKQTLDGYDYFVLIVCAALLIYMGLKWLDVQGPTYIIALLSLCSYFLYAKDYDNSENLFLLKYFLSSQSAIGWMCALYIAATFVYLAALVFKSRELIKWGRGLNWTATILGISGLLVRWYESYLINPEYGHIPVSNLYEVFILFCIISALIYLYYEKESSLEFLGFFALTIISAAVIFALWYSNSRGADEIAPLVPALKSYWMKLHVPSNFIGYGCFALAAMLSVAYIIRGDGDSILPQKKLISDVIYRLIAFGFAFFTIATILGALWAAEAWGNYWSWDPKETWALIVWLNYAAWLHFRLNKGWKNNLLAWWAIVGLFVTLFAFIGVNMFLSGLHSYGEL